MELWEGGIDVFLEKWYLWLLVPMEAYVSFVHPWLMGERMAFLPLLLVSVYCGIGLLHAFIRLYAIILPLSMPTRAPGHIKQE